MALRKKVHSDTLKGTSAAFEKGGSRLGVGRGTMVRGVRALLKATAPGKLAKAGKFACFRARTDSNRPTGPKLRGITKLLTSASTRPRRCRARAAGAAARGPVAKRRAAPRPAVDCAGRAPGQRVRADAEALQDAQADAPLLQRARLPRARAGGVAARGDRSRSAASARRSTSCARGASTSWCWSSSKRGSAATAPRARARACSRR